MLKKIIMPTLVLLSLLVLAACGADGGVAKKDNNTNGGGGDNTSSTQDNSTPTYTTLSATTGYYTVGDYKVYVAANGDVNVFFMQKDDSTDIILFDSGYPGFNAITQFTEAGFKVENVKTVLLTHIHPDHIGALIAPVDMINPAPPALTYPNAKILVNKEEYNYMKTLSVDPTDPIYNSLPLPIKMVKDIFTQLNILASDKIVQFDIDDLTAFKTSAGMTADNITITPLPGHTFAHLGYEIESKGKRLFIAADFVNNPVNQFSDTSATTGLDLDETQAIASREFVMAYSVTDKVAVAGSHLPFPGVATIAEDGVVAGTPNKKYKYTLIK